MLISGGDIQLVGIESDRYQQRLHRGGSGVKRIFQFFVHHTLMGRMHIHDHQPFIVLSKDVNALQLRQGKSQGRYFLLRLIERCLPPCRIGKQGFIKRHRMRDAEVYFGLRCISRRNKRIAGSCARRIVLHHRGRQRLVERVVYKLMHGARIAETHLDFSRMYIDIHHSGIDFQEQHECRMALVVQDVVVGFAQRMGDQLVAHIAAVDVKILGIARASRIGGKTRHPPQAQPRGLFIDDHRGRCEIIAQHRAHAVMRILRGEPPLHARVMLQGEAHVSAA